MTVYEKPKLQDSKYSYIIADEACDKWISELDLTVPAYGSEEELTGLAAWLPDEETLTAEIKLTNDMLRRGGYDHVANRYDNLAAIREMLMAEEDYLYWNPLDQPYEQDTVFCNCYVPQPVNISLFRAKYVCKVCDRDIEEK